jgi:hypothetical protein
MTSDHRVEGSSPAGCNRSSSLKISDLRENLFYSENVESLIVLTLFSLFGSLFSLRAPLVEKLVDRPLDELFDGEARRVAHYR